MSLLRRAVYAAGMIFRETGQALDRAGSRLQGSYAFKEHLSRHRQIMNLKTSKPLISSEVFIAPNASVIGNVELQPTSSIWYGAVLRADTSPIYIGPATNIQDRVVISGPTSIGASTTVQPSASIIASSIGSNSKIGAGAILDHATIGNNVHIRPGAVVKGTVPDGEVWEGAPAVKVGLVQDEAAVKQICDDYLLLAAAHADETGKTHEQIEGEVLRRVLLEERSEDYHSHMGLIGREDEIVDTQARIAEAEREEQAKIGVRA